MKELYSVERTLSSSFFSRMKTRGVRLKEFRKSQGWTIKDLAKKIDISVGAILKHSYITRSLEKGIPAEDVMLITGNTSFKTFRRYDHPIERLDRAVEAISRKRSVI